MEKHKASKNGEPNTGPQIVSEHKNEHPDVMTLPMERRISQQQLIKQAEKAAELEQSVYHGRSGIDYILELPDNIEITKLVAKNAEFMELAEMSDDDIRRWSSERAEDLDKFTTKILKTIIIEPVIVDAGAVRPDLEEKGILYLPYDKIPRADRNGLYTAALELMGLDKKAREDIDFFRERDGVRQGDGPPLGTSSSPDDVAHERTS